MAGLQRSVETFRRSGSSGLVWEERFSGELTQGKKTMEGAAEAASMELRRSNSTGSAPTEQRSGGRTTFRTGKVTPSMDPPSPKVSACGFCGFFGKPTPSSSSSSSSASAAAAAAKNNNNKKRPKKTRR